MDRDGGLQEPTRVAAPNGAFAPGFDQPLASPVEHQSFTEFPLHDDQVDQARSQLYGLLAALLLRPPDRELLTRLAKLQGTATPLGLAQIALAETAGATSAESARREYFDLFIGVGRGELVPYASFYLTGFLYDRPLVRLRDDLKRLGLKRAEGHHDPEDHIGTLLEIMSGLAARTIDAPRDEERQFFRIHLAPWAGRFFSDLETAEHGNLYRALGTVGRVFVEIEAEAFEMGQ